MQAPTELGKKRVYQQPKLLRYGSLTEMTASTGSGSKNDNVPHTSPMKT